VRGRNSNNDLIREKLGWDYQLTLEEGLTRTYAWINEQVKKENLVKDEVTKVREKIAF